MSPRANERIRKLVGGFRGDKAVQPGQHVIILPGPPAAPGGACFGLPGTWSEGFGKADGAGWGPDLRWVPVMGFISDTGPATVSGHAAVAVPAPCLGNGIFSANAWRMPDNLLSPDQVVSVKFTSFTPTWAFGTAGAGSEYDNQIALYARINEDIPGYQAWYSAGFTRCGLPGGPSYCGISKNGHGNSYSIANTLTGPAIVAGDVLSLEVIGNTVTAKHNGTTVLTGSGHDPSGITGPDWNPPCSYAALLLTTVCVDVTATGQGPFTGPGGWAPFYADDFSVVAS